MKNLSAIKPNEDDYFLIYRKRKKGLPISIYEQENFPQINSPKKTESISLLNKIPKLDIDKIKYPAVFTHTSYLIDKKAKYKAKYLHKQYLLSIKYLKFLSQENLTEDFLDKIVKIESSSNNDNEIAERLETDKSQTRQKIKEFLSNASLNETVNTLRQLDNIPNSEIEKSANYIIDSLNNKNKFNNETDEEKPPKLVIHNIFFEWVIKKIIHKMEIRNQYNQVITVKYVINLLNNEVKTLKTNIIKYVNENEKLKRNQIENENEDYNYISSEENGDEEIDNKRTYLLTDRIKYPNKNKKIKKIGLNDNKINALNAYSRNNNLSERLFSEDNVKGITYSNLFENQSKSSMKTLNNRMSNKQYKLNPLSISSNISNITRNIRSNISIGTMTERTEDKYFNHSNSNNKLIFSNNNMSQTTGDDYSERPSNLMFEGYRRDISIGKSPIIPNKKREIISNINKNEDIILERTLENFNGTKNSFVNNNNDIYNINNTNGNNLPKIYYENNTNNKYSTINTNTNTNSLQMTKRTDKLFFSGGNTEREKYHEIINSINNQQMRNNTDRNINIESYEIKRPQSRSMKNNNKNMKNSRSSDSQNRKKIAFKEEKNTYYNNNNDESDYDDDEEEESEEDEEYEDEESEESNSKKGVSLYSKDFRDTEKKRTKKRLKTNKSHKSKSKNGSVNSNSFERNPNKKRTTRKRKTERKKNNNNIEYKEDEDKKNRINKNNINEKILKLKEEDERRGKKQNNNKINNDIYKEENKTININNDNNNNNNKNENKKRYSIEKEYEESRRKSISNLKKKKEEDLEDNYNPLIGAEKLKEEQQKLMEEIKKREKEDEIRRIEEEKRKEQDKIDEEKRLENEKRVKEFVHKQHRSSLTKYNNPAANYTKKLNNRNNSNDFLKQLLLRNNPNFFNKDKFDEEQDDNVNEQNQYYYQRKSLIEEEDNSPSNINKNIRYVMGRGSNLNEKLIYDSSYLFNKNEGEQKFQLRKEVLDILEGKYKKNVVEEEIKPSNEYKYYKKKKFVREVKKPPKPKKRLMNKIKTIKFDEENEEDEELKKKLEEKKKAEEEEKKKQSNYEERLKNFFKKVQALKNEKNDKFSEELDKLLDDQIYNSDYGVNRRHETRMNYFLGKLNSYVIQKDNYRKFKQRGLRFKSPCEFETTKTNYNINFKPHI